MKKKYVKSTSILMAGSMVFSMVPENVLKVSAADEKVLFSTDFENSSLPDYAGGLISLNELSIESIGDNNNKALKFNCNKDNNGVYEFSFVTQYNKNVIKNSKLEYDIIISNEMKDYEGELISRGALENSSLNKTDLDNIKILCSDFADLGNGYSKVHVVSELKEDFNDLYKIDINVDNSNCDLKGDIYLDDIRLTTAYEKAQKEEGDNAAVSNVLRKSNGVSWDFEDETLGTMGWNFAGVWDYKGTPVVSFDKDAVGGGSLKLDVDYSANADSGWSEVKLENKIENGVDMNKYNQLKFNFYYNQNNMTKGSFKVKFFADDSLNTDMDINLSKGEDVGNGLKKVPVTVNFDSKDINIDGIILSIVGCNTNYKGSLYIDDINLTYKDASDIYVDKTSTATSNPSKIDVNALNTPSEVKLVDSDAIDEVGSLLAYLHGVGKEDRAIFGHQNDTYNKAGSLPGGSESDTKDLTGSIAGICGIDSLSFTGDELSLPEGDTRDYVTAAADVSKNAAKQGAIVTLSCHMPNFAKVAEKGKDENGNYDYSGYSAPSTTGDVVNRIMPGGDLNEIFTGYLDMVADYGKQLEAEGIPVLFRPFHENNGSWFWWGKAFCDGQTYKNLYAYTVEYLRDVKDVHNFLYVYSPNGPFRDEEDYLERYPGDAFVDVMAFDQYHTNPQADGDNDPWFASLKENIQIVQSAAKKHGKLATLSETGVQITNSPDYEVSNCALPQYGNLNKEWFSDVSKIVSESDMPYYMVWANFNNKSNFYVPYLVSENKGHEMINEFIDYYNEESSVFANGIGDYTSLKVNKESPYEYGYIEGPISGGRILEPTVLKAKVKSNSNDVKFVIKNKKGNVIETLDGKLNNENGLYEAEITRGLLDKIGEQSGVIELVVNGKTESYSNYVFNIEEPKEVNEIVDDFESYGDEESLLNRAWNSSNGDGCSVTPSLITDEDGNHKMKFSYKISTEKISEGYAGVVKSKAADWSEYDALQLYIKPDGNGQKLVIQITANGEAFEVYLPEFAATTEGQTLTIPFSEFKGKKNGKFDPSNIESFGLWCNTIVPEGHNGAFTVDSSFEFDNIKAVKMSEVEAVKKAEEAVVKAEESLSKEDLENARTLVEALNNSDKERLGKRLDDVEKTIAAIDRAEEAILKAEQSLNKEDLENARKLVEELPSHLKDSYEKRLESIENQIAQMENEKAEEDNNKDNISGEENNAGEENNESEDVSNTESSEDNSTKTGDKSNILLWTLSMAGALSLCLKRVYEKVRFR